MAHLTAAGTRAADIVSSPVYRDAARSVTRVLVPACLVLLALALLEVVSTGDVLSLQLAAFAVLVLTMPGTLIATEAVARLRVDRTIRRMERGLRAVDSKDA